MLETLISFITAPEWIIPNITNILFFNTVWFWEDKKDNRKLSKIIEYIYFIW